MDLAAVVEPVNATPFNSLSFVNSLPISFPPITNCSTDSGTPLS